LPLSLLNAVFPLSLILSPISPLAQALSTHSAELPFSLVLPPLLLTQEKPFPVLVTVLIVSLIKVTVSPLSNALSVRQVRTKVADIQFITVQMEFAKSIHCTVLPIANVLLLEV
jgi:hypothetical protein